MARLSTSGVARARRLPIRSVASVRTCPILTQERFVGLLDDVRSAVFASAGATGSLRRD